MRIPTRKTVIAGVFGLGAAGSLAMGFATSARAQITVFDPSNYGQNILTAARTLQQVNNQIRSLQNEAQTLLRLDRNLKGIAFPQLQALIDRLDGIDRLMKRAQSVDFEMDQLEDKLRTLYPRTFDQASTRDQRLQAARARYDASTDALRRTMTIQSGIVQQAREDAEALADIAARSQGAEGALAVGQATNQLLALTAKQGMALQQMMAAQFRADALERQRQLTESEASRAATRKFLGAGTAYTLQQ
ncbi:P-type conjugative transfer protein TrbJ [Sphingomonas qomolangmaensis]|uniref:P-type conjugative transfer protein TrbJ n=1 Tax=Sphingomonas qomolangmaensis TaxID=2918765 RepID=A0ABY5LA28_9SPHN|nr:P-type conjugative transfer protein TrbJ [Sphingomonas qomolangmaensis]UUL82589.1 P-type conjugative transfer protein TrbJ [Sphingomonas qomolangmaensis]